MNMREEFEKVMDRKEFERTRCDNCKLYGDCDGTMAFNCVFNYLEQSHTTSKKRLKEWAENGERKPEDAKSRRQFLMDKPYNQCLKDLISFIEEDK